MSKIISTHGPPDLDLPEREVGGTVLFLLIPMDEKIGARLLRMNTREVPDSIVIEDLMNSPLAKDDSDGRRCLSTFAKLDGSPR